MAYGLRHSATRPISTARPLRPRLLVRAAKETAEEAIQRRLRESQQVEERVILVSDKEQLSDHLSKSEDLVVLEATSDEKCDTGLTEEVELNWDLDQKKREKDLEKLCSQIKHVFQRTARECKDIKFLTIDSDTESGSLMCEELGIDVIPTLQFYKKGQLLWEHKGALHLQQDLGEGVLYYANTYAGGADASDFVYQIKSKKDFESFVGGENDKVLKVVDVSVKTAEPCIHIYPAVLALAKNFKGYVSFARMLLDDTGLEDLGKELNIIDVPTFLFYKEGKEIDRHAGSSRADLIGHILSIQGMSGLPPPPKNRSKAGASN